MSSLRQTQESLIVQSVMEVARKDGFVDLPAGLKSELSYFEWLDSLNANGQLTNHGKAVLQLQNREQIKLIVARQLVARWALYREFKDEPDKR